MYLGNRLCDLTVRESVNNGLRRTLTSSGKGGRIGANSERYLYSA